MTLSTDLHPSTHALAAALIADPFYRAVSVQAGEDEAQRQQLLAGYFQLALDEAQAVGEVHTQGAEGAALWLLPTAGAEQALACSAARTRALQPLLGAQGMAAYLDICAAMAQQVPAELDQAWYLSILGVHPRAQGQGLAQRLLAPTLARADQAGAACFLETFNPRSLGFYARLGFVPHSEAREPTTGSAYWILQRPPQG